MLKRLTASAVILGLLSPVFAFPREAFAYDPAYLLSDAEMVDTHAMTLEEIQSFMSRGSLATYSTTDAFGRRKTAAEIVYEAAQLFDLNPQFILVLLQREQSVVEDDDPSQDQLDWAMGYAICDSCQKNDPSLQKYRGFGNQVYYAAKRIRESYLADLETIGFTIGGVGPDIVIDVDGQTIIPVNFATSVLYTYTPHLHGNENFVKIWDRWFVRDYPSGTLLQDATTGAVWLIQYGKRRPITSRTAFLTRFNEKNIIQVKPSVLASYEIGNPISFPNYSLLRSPRGTVYLIVDDSRRGFASQEAMRAIGINPDEIIDVSWEDLDAYTEGLPITAESSTPLEALLQDSTTGGVFAVSDGMKHPIMSREILSSRYPGWSIRSATADELASYTTGDPVGFADGTLIGVSGSPDVFVVSDGLRRPIMDETTFLGFGWRWNQIVWTNERSVLNHELGEPIVLEIPEAEEEPPELTQAGL